MFETVAIESKPHPIRKGRMATLPVSVALHALAISGVIVSNVWTVSLPTNAPAQYEAFQGARTVPVPPREERPVHVDPPKPATPQTREQQQSVFTDPPAQNPTTLTPVGTPDYIPNVEPGVGGPAEVAVGDPSLVGPGGSGSGDDVDRGPVQVGPGRATMPEVLARVQPVYPVMLVKIGLRGTATVECIVGRDGTIESARVVRATHALFGEAARDAVLQWKFRPGKLQGQPVATIFQLTVSFEVRH